MNTTLLPGPISGTIMVPPSKSYTQRVLACALLHQGVTRITNAGTSADELAAKHIIQELGAQCTTSGNTLIITDAPLPYSPTTIHCGESGLAARLFLPIAASAGHPITVTGSGSLLRRSMAEALQSLQSLGVHCSSVQSLPATVCGPISVGNTSIYASTSSQHISGLLIALAFSSIAPVTLQVAGLVSTPYIDITIQVLAAFGHTVTHTHYQSFTIIPATQPLAEVNITIEADWSSASCLLVAGAIAGYPLTLQNLNIHSAQADRAILQVLHQVGADITINDSDITLQRKRMSCFDFDATHCPDLFPALAALASFCFGESAITGVDRLFNKESNRIESITEMLWQFGIPFAVGGNALFITGREKVRYTHIDSYNDHRIAMAAATCALRARGPVTITHSEAINKSYPNFFSHLAQCQVDITTAEDIPDQP